MSTQIDRWWLALPGQEPAGPYTRDEIRSRVTGDGRDWQVCAEDSDHWRAWRDVDGGPASPPPPRSAPPSNDPNWSFTPSTSGVTPAATPTYLMFMHLSQFAGYIVPLAGLVVPIVMWLTRREDPEVDRHGREIANWMIFEFIMAVVFGLLALVIIGIPFLIILGVLAVVCPIIAAVQASSGGFFKYPMFFRVL
jgi:uncharacterized Tic20 family protein